MKVAAAVMDASTFLEFDTYDKLLVYMKKCLYACYEQNVDIAVFPALLPNLFNHNISFVDDICKLSDEFCDIAICPGSWWEADGESTYHTSGIVLDGRMILRQRQLYLAKWEREEKLNRGKELEVVLFKDMKVGILLSTDVFYPQAARQLAALGAELILSPTVLLKGVNQSALQLSGVWQKVQVNFFYAVESGFKGNIDKRTFYSRSAIHAPLEVTPKENGFLQLENNKNSSPIITAELDKGKLEKAINAFDVMAQLNKDAYKEMFCKEGI